MIWVKGTEWLSLRAKLRFAFFHVNVTLVLLNFSMSPIQLNRLQQVLHLLVSLSIDCIINLIDKEVIILLLSLFLFYLMHLKILFALFHPLLWYQIERRWHLFWNFRPLNFAHSLSHLLFIWISDSYDLIGCRNLALTDLMRVFHVVLEL